MKTLLSSSFFDAISTSIKDYIQPILQAIILASSVTIIRSLNKEDVLSIYLAAIYGAVYLLSAAGIKARIQAGQVCARPQAYGYIP